MSSVVHYIIIALTICCALAGAGTVSPPAPKRIAQCFAATFRSPFAARSGLIMPAILGGEIAKNATVGLFSQDEFYSIRGENFYQTHAVRDGGGGYFLVDPTQPSSKLIWGSGRAANGGPGAMIIANTADTPIVARIEARDQIVEPAVIQHATDLYLREIKSRLASLVSPHRIFANPAKWRNEEWTTNGNVESLRRGLCDCEEAGLFPELIGTLKELIPDSWKVEEDDGQERSLKAPELLCPAPTS